MGDKLVKPPIQTPSLAAERTHKFYTTCFWELTCGFYNLLHRSNLYSIPLSIQFGRTRFRWVQVEIEYYECFDTYTKSILYYTQIWDWQAVASEKLDRQIEQREAVKREEKAEEVVATFCLLQKLFCIISEIHTRSVQHDLGVLIKFRQIEGGVHLTATFQPEEGEIRYERTAKDANQLMEFNTEVIRRMREILKIEDDEEFVGDLF